MENNKTLSKTTSNRFPINNETKSSPADFSEKEEMPHYASNPAMQGYYDSQKRKNNAVTVLIWIGIPLLGFVVAVAAYYFASIREPIIRLEDKVDFLNEQTKVNSDAIDSLKQSIYSNQIRHTQPQQ